MVSFKNGLFAAAAAAVFALSVGSAMAQDLIGDPAEGEKVFRKCRTCHTLDKARVGPPLGTVIGRQPGTVEGFRYSKNMIEYGETGVVWTPETIDPYVKNPKEIVPRGSMAFIGLPKEEDRKNVIAYLQANQEPQAEAAPEAAAAE